MQNPDTGHTALRCRADAWARHINVRPRAVRIRSMARKWGSCSTRGIVTLAADLADQQPGFRDFVIAHELLHLRVPNHGRLFKALMSAHVPAWSSYRRIPLPRWTATRFWPHSPVWRSTSKPQDSTSFRSRGPVR